MASPQVTVRMDRELYKTLVVLARTEEKTIANFTRDLIEEGLNARKSEKILGSATVLERLDLIVSLLKAETQGTLNGTRAEAQMTALVLKAIRAAAAGQSYARQAAIAAQDIASIWGEQIGAVESSDSRKEAIGKMDVDSQDFAQWWVRSG